MQQPLGLCATTEIDFHLRIITFLSSFFLTNWNKMTIYASSGMLYLNYFIIIAFGRTISRNFFQKILLILGSNLMYVCTSDPKSRMHQSG